MNLGLNYSLVRKSIFSGQSTSRSARVSGTMCESSTGRKWWQPSCACHLHPSTAHQQKKETQSRLTVDSNARDRNLSSKWLDWLDKWNLAKSIEWFCYDWTVLIFLRETGNSYKGFHWDQRDCSKPQLNRKRSLQSKSETVKKIILYTSHRCAFDDFFAQGSRHWKATSGPQLVWIFKQWVTRFNLREFLFTNIMTFLSRMLIIPTDMGTSAAHLWWTPPLGWLSLLASPWQPSSSGPPNRHRASYEAMLLIYWTSWLFLCSNNFLFNVYG